MISKMVEPPKNGVRMVVFLTKDDFRNTELYDLYKIKYLYSAKY